MYDLGLLSWIRTTGFSVITTKARRSKSNGVQVLKDHRCQVKPHNLVKVFNIIEQEKKFYDKNQQKYCMTTKPDLQAPFWYSDDDLRDLKDRADISIIHCDIKGLSFELTRLLFAIPVLCCDIQINNCAITMLNCDVTVDSFAITMLHLSSKWWIGGIRLLNDTMTMLYFCIPVPNQGITMVIYEDIYVPDEFS